MLVFSQLESVASIIPPLDLLNLIFLIHSRLAEIAMPQRHMLRAQIHKYTHKMLHEVSLPACHYYNPKNNTQTLRITQRVKKVCFVVVDGFDFIEAKVVPKAWFCVFFISRVDHHPKHWVEMKYTVCES